MENIVKKVMRTEVVKSLLEGISITSSDSKFKGSYLLLDGGLIDQAGFYEYEKVRVYNHTTNVEFETYLVAGPKFSGACVLTGYVADKGQDGDKLTILSYIHIDHAEIVDWRPKVVNAGASNRQSRS